MITTERQEYCPYHPAEQDLRLPTKLPSVLRIAERNNDKVFYCKGDSGKCTWAYSQLVGMFMPPGLRVPRSRSQQCLEILSAYTRALAEMPKVEPVKNYGAAPWEI